MKMKWIDSIAIALMLVASSASACDKDINGGWKPSGGTSGNQGGNGQEKPEPKPEPAPDAQKLYEEFGISAEEDALGKALAFPGAEGGGMYTTGGRGGQVLHVTNLNDSGEGSLRAAIETKGARTIVFDVAGIISLQSKLKIKEGNLTIAGQTAPGDGICIRNYSTVVEADNVIIRYLRFRLGDTGPNADDSEDCIWGRYHSNIIIDHCSMSWSIDECASFYANEYFTLQWCILTESLKSSKHGKGDHGYGGIWGGRNASFHHNMLANHLSRNPRFDHPEIYPTASDGTFDLSRRGNVDFRNNVIYNWGDNNSYGGEGAWYNMVGNIYKPGPASKDRKYIMDAYGVYTRSDKTTVNYGYAEFYLYGNVHTAYPEITADNVTGIYWHNGTVTPSNEGKIKTAEFAILGSDGSASHITTHSAETAAERIISYGGASLSRDAVDVRACADFRSGTATFPDGGNGSSGGLIDTQAAVGGWPEYTADAEAVSRTLDSDGDGMPDWFEKQFSLDAGDASDAAAKSLDVKGRYTNLEMYLHYLVRNISAGQNEGGSYSR